MCGHIFRALGKLFCEGCQISILRVPWSNLTKRLVERSSVLCIIFFLTLSERFHKWFKSCIERIKMDTSEKIFDLAKKNFGFWAGQFEQGGRNSLLFGWRNHFSETVFWTLLRVCAKQNGRLVKIALYVSKLSLGIFLPEYERIIFGLWSVIVRMVIKNQSFMSTGSYLGNKYFEHVCGLQAKKFSRGSSKLLSGFRHWEGCQNSFFKVRRNIVEMCFLEHFPQFELKFFGRVIKIAFYVSKVYILRKIFGLCTEYLRTLNEIFSAGFWKLHSKGSSA